MSIPSWKLVLRNGFLPILPLKGVQALAEALRTDDKRLITGATTVPAPLLSMADEPVTAADAIGFACWQGNDLHTVGEVVEAFTRACYDCDQLIGEPAAGRWFLNEWDYPSSIDFRNEMLAEIEDFLRTGEAAFEASREGSEDADLVACGSGEDLPF